ncbi:hypothetical protein PIROE2DRAFT_1541 [Piromyces sp. E2]|nr:hypothetical protein PIROE2DRAFT_1541 [Piromyces sp. E2]|eukprot:OUM70384.1 hypothetical protein PIROE2DRAFT_1541 [Piromyces sp. E2]
MVNNGQPLSTSCTNTSAAKCGFAKNTYCLDSGKLMKGADDCSLVSMTQGDYFVFKKEADTNIFSLVEEEMEGGADQYVVYVAGDQTEAGAVSQVTSKNVYQYNTLYICMSEGEYTVQTDKGLYFDEKDLKPITCDGESCKVDNVAGVFYTNENIYRCVGSSEVTCSLVTQANASNGDLQAYDTGADGNPDKIHLKTNNANKDIIDFSAEGITYIILASGMANDLIQDNNKILVKVSASYMVKVDPKTGYYLNGGEGVSGLTNALIYCSADDIEKCGVIGTAVVGYYAIGGVTGSESSYIECNGDSIECSQVDIEDYESCGSMDAVPECDQVTNPLAVCREGAVEGEVCFVTTAKKFYESGRESCVEMKDQDRRQRFLHFNAQHKRILPQTKITGRPVIYECQVAELSTLGTCDTAPNSSAECKVSSSAIEYCKKNGVVYRTEGDSCVEAEEGELYNCALNRHTLPSCGTFVTCLDEGYCIDDNGKLHVKVSGSCQLVDIKTNAVWYFDKEFKRMDEVTSDSIIYTRYSCVAESDVCNIVADKALGEVIRMAPHQLEMCLGVGVTLPLLSTSSGQSYHAFIPGSGEFAGLGTGSAVINIKSTGNSIIQITGAAAALTTCSAGTTTDNLECSSTAGVYCINDGNVIVKGDPFTCTKLEHTTESTTAPYFFDKEGKLVESVADDTIAKAYTCAFDADKTAETCVLLKGYAVDGSNVVTCNGVTGDTCIVSDLTTCTTGEDGRLGRDSSGKASLCLGDRALNLPETPGYYAYPAPADNVVFTTNVYGKGKFTLLRVGPDYASLVEGDYPATSGSDYFINNLNPGINRDASSEPLVKCDYSGNVITGCVGVPAGGTSPSDPVKYYLNVNVDAKSLIRCTFMDKCETVTIVDAAFTSGTKYYVNGAGTPGTIIKCTGGEGCKIETSITNGNLYISGADDKAVLSCDGTNCVSEKYVGVKANAVGRTGELVVQCDGSAACTYTTSVTASTLKYNSGSFQFKGSVDFATLIEAVGYDIISKEDAKALFNVEAKSLVKVSAKSITKVVVSAGYYARPMTGLTKSLIHCTGTDASTCTILDTVTPGYYVAGEDAGSVVECTNDCTLTPVVQTTCTSPAATKTLPSCTVTSGGNCSSSGENTYCISDNALFKNGSNSCSKEEGDVDFAEGVETFSFDSDGKRVDTTGGVSIFALNSVAYTYKCEVDAGRVVSNCELVGRPLPVCDNGAGAARCINNGAIHSVCVKARELFQTTAYNECAPFTVADAVYHFDENFMPLSDDADPALVKYSYACANDNCDPTRQTVGGIIKTSTATPPVTKTLPMCTATDYSDVCSGANDDDNNNGSHCIDSTGVIYQNTVTGSGTSKGCAKASGSTESTQQYFAFDAEGKRVDDPATTGKVTGDNASLVASTYLCSTDTVGNGKVVSKCILNGNQLPRCDVDDATDARCYNNAPVNSVCATKAGALLVTRGIASCVALTGMKETVSRFDAQFHEITNPAASVPVAYAYYCATGGNGVLAALSNCFPLPPSQEEGMTAGEPVLKMCTSLSDTDAVSLHPTTTHYMPLTLTAGDTIPGVLAPGRISVKISGEGSVMALPEADEDIPSCDVDGSRRKRGVECQVSKSVVRACRNGSVISITGGGSCSTLTGPQGQKALSYYKDGVAPNTYDPIASPTTESTDIAYAYECQFATGADGTSKDATSCTRITGYKVRESPVSTAIYCSGLTGESCVIHNLSPCVASDVGKLGKSGSDAVICFGTANKIKLVADTPKVAFYTSEYSPYYGKYGIVLLDVGATTVKSTETSAAGYYVNENSRTLKNALIYCTGAYLSDCKVMDAVNGYYKSAIDNYVINCNATNGCTKVKIEHMSCGYKDVLPECEKNGPLTDDVCSEDGNDTYCLGSDQKLYKNVISGQSKSCALAVPSDTNATSVKFYFNASKKSVSAGSLKSYYRCQSIAGVISGCVLEREPLKECPTGAVSTTAACYTGAATDSVCINSSKALLKSGTGKCEAVTGTANSLVYFDQQYKKKDDASASGVVYTYRCKKAGSGGALSNCEPEYQKAGGIITVNRMCTSNDDAATISITGTAFYKKVKVASFPGVTTADTTIKVKNTGAGGLIEIKDLASLPTCTNAGVTTDVCKVAGAKVSYCIKNDVIYQSVSGKCPKVAGEVNATGFLFFDRDGESVDPEGGDTVSYAYQCTFDGNGLASRCRLARGYIKAGANMVNCNGWKGDDCVIEAIGSDSCIGRDEGEINRNGQSICFGASDKLALPADGKIYATFTTAKEINRAYGIQKEDGIIFLELTAEAVLLSSYTGLDPVYLIDQTNKASDDDKKPLIRCTSDEGCVAMASGTVDKVTATDGTVKREGLAHTYYIDGAYPLADHIITCTHVWKNEEGVVTVDAGRGKCVSTVAAEAVNYYVDSAQEGNLITCGNEASASGYADLPVCENPVGTRKCIAGAGVGTHCTRSGKLFVTTAASSKCQEVKWCTSSVSPFGIYATGSSVDKEKIIRCGRYVEGSLAVTCQYYDAVTIPTDCVDTDSNAKNQGKIGIADGVFKMCDNKEGKALNTVNPGYMLMTAETAAGIFEGATTSMLIENNGGWMAERSVRNGYFLNIDSDQLDYPVIQCSTQTGCAKVGVDDVHCTNVHAKLPTCTDVTSEKVCYAEAAVDSFCIKAGKLYRTLNDESVKCQEVHTYDTCTSVASGEACIAGAAENTLCLKEGKTYLSLSTDCVDVSGLAECTSIKADAKCQENAEENSLCRKDDKVYKTVGTSCSEVVTLLDGLDRLTYYFDASYKRKESSEITATSTIQSVYKCTQRNGNLSSCEKSVREPGELIYSQTASPSDRQYQVCQADGNTIAVSANMGHRTIGVDKVNAFPGVILPGPHTVHFGKGHVVLVQDRTLLPECDAMVQGHGCTSDGLDVSYCIMNGAMYLSSATACAKMVGGKANEVVYQFFADAETLVPEDQINIHSAIAFVYRCVVGVADNQCSVVRGYLKANGLIIGCNGWTDLCTVTSLNPLDTDCVDVVEGRDGQLNGDASAICFFGGQGDRVDLPTSATLVKYVMFKAEQANPLYGRHTHDIVVLALTNRSVTLVTEGDEIVEGYHLNHKVRGTLTDALIYCPVTGRLEECRVVNGLDGYYLNSDPDNATKQVIRCERYLGCRKLSVDQTVCTEAGTLIKSGGIKFCTRSSGSTAGAVLLTTDTVLPTYQSITDVDASFPGTIDENTSFVKIGVDGTVTLLDHGYYRNEAVVGRPDDALYQCTTEDVKTVCDKKSAFFGYYRNAGSVGGEDVFLECDVNGCHGIAIDEQAICTRESVGQLVGSGLAPTLCIDYDEALEEDVNVVLAGTEAVHDSYMVGYHSGNIFGLEADEYAYVHVTADAVKLRSSDYIEYVYTLDNGGYKEHGSSCVAEFDNQTLNEFRFKDYGIYTLNCVEGEEKNNLCPKEYEKEEEGENSQTE